MKSLKTISSIIVLTLVFASCSHFKGYTIDGKITGGLIPAIKKVYLEQLGTTKTTVIDTSVIDKDGSFKMKGFVKDEGLYRLKFTGDKFIFLIMENKPITISINLDSVGSYTITGSPASTILKSFLDTLTKRTQEKMLLQMKITQTNNKDTLAGKQREEAFKKFMILSSTTSAYVYKFIDTVKDPIVAIYAANTLDFSENIAMFQSLSKKLLKQNPDNTFVKDYAQLINQISEQIASNNASSFKVGDHVPDISLPNPDGKMISLSSLKGKYVLLDFWASWCQPCRHENPNIVKAYEKYKDKGFTVYSVSLDDNKDHWKTAISYDKLSWPNHVSELKGWDSKVVSEFHFDAIPHNLLLDTQGKVLAIDLRGDALENALSSLVQ